MALLWHMHQPYYEDLATGEHVLPWVRLHALKDYWGMAAVLAEFPGIRLTFNLVPSLLVQIQSFAREEARDRHLELGLKAADRLTDEERADCVDQFFHAHRERMIEAHPRYRELLALRGAVQAAQFSLEDLRDLQVWHKLAWIDPWYQAHDPRVQRLLERGRGFTEEDKAVLREVELEILRRVIPEYAAAAARGQIELSTSPFYHPILPLLCDSDVHLRAHPQSRMPREPFRHPEDAAEQLARAVSLHETLFGAPPAGLWPSEGSVSDAMVPLVAEAGFRWMATDEEILARTLATAFARSGDGHLEQPERLYRPYLVGTGARTVACGFRDRTLSDLIGFSYAWWSAEGAADDFVHRLVTGGRRFAARTGGEEATIFVILDGENAWEHYEGQGRPFLRALYARLEAHPEIRTVTMHEACAGARERIPSVFPGSWINADFYIWMGHQDDHRAWGQLAAARRALAAAQGAAPAAAAARAHEEILIAEGSDWFWWYGDDHSSEHDVQFDELFRRHLRNAYRALDLAVPEELLVTNITTRPPAVVVDPPTGFINPRIDGEISSYFEWIGAGGVETAAVGGTMHQVDVRPVVARVEFGVDLETLYIRVDGTRPMRALLEPGVDLQVKFIEPAGVQVIVRVEEGQVRAWCDERPGSADVWRRRHCGGIGAAAGTVLEMRIPFACLGVAAPGRIGFLVSVTRHGIELERHPRLGPIECALPDAPFLARNWTA